jgi:hypothetical protein
MQIQPGRRFGRAWKRPDYTLSQRRSPVDGTFIGCGTCSPWNPPRTWHYKGAGMGLLISILITFLVIILVLYLINMLPIDGRAKQIVRVIVIIIGVLSLLKYLAVF